MSFTPVDVFSLVTPVGISDVNTSYVLRQMPMTKLPQRQMAKESVGISISIVSDHAFFRYLTRDTEGYAKLFHSFHAEPMHLLL